MIAINIQIIKETIKNILKKNEIFFNSKITRKYECYVHQKKILEFNYVGCIDSVVHLKKSDVSVINLKKAIISLINNNSLLKSYIDKIRDKYYFFELDEINEIDIPIFNVEGVTDKYKDNLINDINQFFSDDVYRLKLKKLLYQIYILEDKNYFIVVFSLHHLISDGATKNVILRQLYSIINNSRIENNISYKNYIDLIQHSNEDSRIIHEFVEKAIKVNNLLQPIKKKKVFWEEVRIIKAKLGDEITWNDVVIRVGYILGIIGCEFYKVKEIMIKAIVNYREFLSDEYQNLIGDCHSSIFFNVEQKESLEEFRKKSIDFIDFFYKKNNIDLHYLVKKKNSLSHIFKELWNTIELGFIILEAVDESKLEIRLNEIAEIALNNLYDSHYFQIQSIISGENLYICIPRKLVRNDSLYYDVLKNY